MKVNRNDAIELLQECGFVSVTEDYTNERLKGKLESLPKAMDEESMPSKKSCKKLLDEITAAVEASEVIEVEGEVKAGKKKGKKPSGKESSKNSKAEGKKKATQPRAEVEKDRFGMRTGTRASSINAVLSAKGMTIQEIMEKSKVSSAIHNHMRCLIEKGFVVKDKEGKYAVKGAGKKK